MASENIFTAFITPDVTAAADLRTHQYKVVNFGAAGIQLATATGSGPLWILANKPNSGDACALIGVPNIAKVYVDSATLRNQFIGLSGATSGVATVMGSAGQLGYFGVALTAVASGSLCDVLLK